MINEYYLQSFELPEYSELIKSMTFEELESERLDMIDLLESTLQKRDRIQKQIDINETTNERDITWKLKAKMAVKHCKRDLQKINLCLSEIKKINKIHNIQRQEQKISYVLKNSYPEIYKEIINLIKEGE